ncbi:MAG: SpoIIE family protein phosphatase [Oligoflexales bacterium]|nr:SpoIIE family protein phosphatase [Oligoflexales bacterium]
MGMREKPAINIRRFRFCNDNMIFLYTDGLTENVNQDGKKLSIMQIVRLMRKSRTALELKQQILAKIGKLRFGRKFEDDYCFIAIRKSGDMSRAS